MRRARLLAALVLAACSSKRHDPTPTPSAPTTTADRPDAGGPSDRRLVIDMVERSSGCTLGHVGILLDLGDPNTHADLAIKEPTAIVERDGATWERVTAKTLTMRFVPPSTGLSLASTDAGKPELFVDARIHSLLAKSASVYINGHAVGTWSLTKGETKLVSAHGTAAAINVGTNQLMVRFNGVPKGSTNDAIAQIDWIRVGAHTEPSYAATTRADAIVTQSVGGVAKRAVSLPAPGFIRCVGFVPRGATLELAIAAGGKGDADIVVRAVKDRTTPRELATLRANDSTWTPVTVAIPDELSGAIMAIEISIPSATFGVRALLGGVRVTAPPLPALPARKPARNALVVVLGQAPPSQLSPYAGKTAMPTLDALAKDGLVFEHHRATTSWAAGSFASVLTGLLPRQHGAEDEAARMSPEPVTIARAARDAGILSAMFTANPTTSAPYGFDRDWVDFESTMPALDSGTRIFDDATQWIAKHNGERFLLVLHARGGHPPWDANAEELKTLPPDAYAGSIEPRHAGEILAKARRVPPQVRFGDADRVRAWALFDLQMRAHDAAIGKLLSALRESGQEDETAVFVTGDASTSASSHVPFGDDATQDETTLTLPLIVKLPAGAGPPSARVSTQTSSLDLARSILSTLGLTAPPTFGGVDVIDAATAQQERSVVATGARGKISLRQGSLVLFGTAERSQLCDLDLDAACATDASSTLPLSEMLMRSGATSVFSAPTVSGQTVVLDPALSAALRAWGR